MDEWPKITVVIPVRNEKKFISETISFIIEQDYPRDKLEIIVADGESDDDTPAIVEKMSVSDPRIRLINNPGRLSSAGRNVGIKNATGEIITFIDGHTFIDNNQLLKNTVRFMREKELKVLSRPQFLETPHNNFFQKAVALARKSIIGHGLDSTIFSSEEKYVDPSSSGASYRKEMFDEIGIYDERFDACEDVELNYRASLAGCRSFTSLKLAVYYYPRKSLGGLFKQLMRYGRGRFRLAQKHPKTLSLGTIIPVLITLGIPLLILASWLYSPVLYLLVVSVYPYLGLILLWSVVVSFRHGLIFLFVLPVIFVIIHTALGWGFIVEGIDKLMGRGIKF